MKNKQIKIIWGLVLIIMILGIFPSISKASSSDLYLNYLEFNAKINPDGSMNVTEIWDISVEDTNTLFKTFKTDRTKYTNITDVKVTQITDNKNNEFSPINEYMYHVTKNCYYGLKNSEGNFEIAWGVGLENQKSTEKYKIEYKVNDVISKYNDYAQLYWQFVGQDFEISSKSIKGTIILPNKVEDKEEIKVWGHTKDLNGTIYATDLNKIEFELNNFRSGRYLEIRTLFPTNLVNSTRRTYNSNILERALSEETKWADEANKQREVQEKTSDTIKVLSGIIAIALVILFIKKIKKYRTILKELNKYEPTSKLEYYRDLPDEQATPGEAVFLLKSAYENFSTEFGAIFSATILNLALKKYIELEVNDNRKGKDAIIIKIINNGTLSLKKDENEILNFLKKAMESQEEITMKDLEKYIKNHPSDIEKLIRNVHEQVKNNVTINNYFDANEYKEYTKYVGKFVLYLVGAIFSLILFPVSIVLIINAIYCYKIENKINVLTQAGIDQKEMWKGLKKYMEDFSLLKEREVPELVIWERFLVFATAFGISEKVLKQLKIVYPNIDQMDNMSTGTYMYFMYHSNFNTNFSNAINSSIASATYSSGSGSGGGFSGGGGGGRRWSEAVEVDNTNTIID